MSDVPEGEGWWQASDGRWYAPTQAPGAPAPSTMGGPAYANEPPTATTAGAAGATSQPPGWYPDPYGQTRWWDGVQWGAPATPTGGGDSGSMAMLAHLLGIVTGFIGPLIIYLTSAKTDPFVRHHAAEALNFHITLAIAYVACFALMCVIIGFFLFPVLIIGSLIFEIQGAIAANRGEWWKYPINIRMVSGAAV
jgi:uncharacterized Tic20 family protein